MAEERPSLAPLSHKPIIEACLQESEGLVWSIEAVPRVANTTADRLAKSGISRDENFFLASVSSLWNQYWVKVWLSLLVYSGAIQMLGSLMVSEPKRGVICVS
ncbi:hypothetical protein V6N11_053658 [Hibiscus sabdariffa]|uniref:RNase H type-1 domain-containing protein n=1 Tax=Hibiscus sabdariffa TaxID=183260 RepID=A0ABR2NEJ3_9ROSI